MVKMGDALDLGSSPYGGAGSNPARGTVLNKMLMIMRWFKKRPKKAYAGYSRLVEKFLWFPLCIGNECRWFETAIIEYERHDISVYGKDSFIEWRPVTFID